MPTPLENYRQHRDEEFEKYCIAFPNAEVGNVYPSIQKFITETDTHLIEMFCEIVGEDSNIRKPKPDGSYEQGFDYGYDFKKREILSQLPNQKQS